MVVSQLVQPIHARFMRETGLSSYLQRILAECESAKQNAASASTSLRPQISSRLSDAPVETNVSNPLIEDQAWFVPHTTPDVPVYIGESSSTAFATSLRQVLDHSCTRGVHVPRTHYVPDTSLVLRPMSSTSWPSEARARLLVKVALAYVGRTHHIILASATFDRLHQIYQDLSCITDVDVGKFFGLFALGEAYSITSKPADGHEVRGLAYFITASKIAQNVPERATLACIENLMLLAFYSHILNRRHSAYHFVGSALRLSMTIGLHHGLPQCFTMSPVLRQHRIRIWWTIYDCDRTWGSELGNPASIQDSTVSVELPSMSGLENKEKEDFADPEYAIANIKLAGIVGDVMTDVYTRKQTQPFLHSVSTILRKLQSWKTHLPDSLKLPHTDTCASLPRNLSSLHLSFDQTVILVTRPVLLHVLKRTLQTSLGRSTSHTTPITPLMSELANASIDAARHIHDLQSQAWISGTLPNVGYFDSLYIFSAAIILAISSILSPAGADKLCFETASQILQTLAENGNLPAAQLLTHLERVQSSIDLHRQNVTSKENETRYRRDEGAFLGAAQRIPIGDTMDTTSIEGFSLIGEEYAGDYFDFLGPLVGFEGESFVGDQDDFGG
ncbi:hypothetical protein PV05_11857 [Exophiala xenobiotica]|uniref:Xylanolytic transcriptional activator regulatory domain-containing protein n=1 Tax=Exophiala xenobiotica TaxID=348802 RepID=A0A0D2E667_9EURO|nr:uncharacterized protein PV05_11857 [Exophiala xenobiotica]KIW50250.1 hypothetical protein PV05_11857 [Exophiala xenobiotica]